MYIGDFNVGQVVYFPFNTFSSDDPSASMTITGLAVTDIEVYKNGTATTRASDSGYTLLDTDGIDFDGITGLHGFSIDTADDTTGGFFVAGADYQVAIASVTLDGATINFWSSFSIDNRASAGKMIATTIATLASQTSFTLTVGSADNSAYLYCTIIISDKASAIQKAVGFISAYTGATKTVTLVADPGVFTMAAGDSVSIIATSAQANIVAIAGGKTAADNLKTAGDSYSATRGFTGTAVPAVAAEAAGGLFTRGSGAGQINQDNNGEIDVDVQKWLGQAVTLSTGNKPDVNINEVSDDATAADDLELLVENAKGTDHKVLISTDAQDLNASLDVNAKAISGSTATADNVESVFLGTGDTDDVDLAARALKLSNDTDVALEILSSDDSAIKAVSSAAGKHGMELAGNGAGNGLLATAGATGDGLKALGGATSGSGIKAEAATEGDGIHALAKGTDEHGILAQGGDTTGDGIHAEAITEGDGVYAIGIGTDEHGVYAVGGDTTGSGIKAEAATSGDGILAVGATNGHGLNVDGAGSGEGINATGGATGAGIEATGGATSGAGIKASAQNNNDAGMELVKNGTGADLDADDLAEVTTARMGALTDWIDNGRLDVILDAAATEAKLLAYVQLLTRSDAAIETDNATELTAINADGGSGAGNYSAQNDSGEAISDIIGTPANIDSGGATLSDNLKKFADDNGGATFDAANHSLKVVRDELDGLQGTDGKAVISTDAQDLSGTLDVNTKTITAGIIAAATFAANALDANALAADAVTEIQSGLATATNVTNAHSTTDGKVDAIQTDLGDFSGRTNNQDLLSVLGVPDVAAKDLHTLLVTDRLDNGTYGLSAIRTRGDAEWITAIGFNTTTPPTVGEIQAEMEEDGASILDTLQDRITAAVALASICTESRLAELDADNLPANVDTIVTSTNLLPEAPQKNTALNDLTFLMVDETDFATPETGLTVTGRVSKDGGAFGAIAGSVAEISNGIYSVDAAAADMNADLLIFRFSATGAMDTFITIKTTS